MGDLEFAQVLVQYRSRMLTRARAIVGNSSDAEDVVQEALERAWRRRGRFTPGSRPAPWLLTITRNVAISLLRRRNKAHVAESGQICVLSGPDRALLQIEHADQIARAIRGLSPSHRRAFMLHHVHGYSHREICAQLHLSYATVRVHLHRARAHIRNALLRIAS